MPSNRSSRNRRVRLLPCIVFLVWPLGGTATAQTLVIDTPSLASGARNAQPMQAMANTALADRLDVSTGAPRPIGPNLRSAHLSFNSVFTPDYGDASPWKSSAMVTRGAGSNSSRVKSTLIGAAIGGAVGVAGGVYYGVATDDGPRGTPIAILGAIGAGAGALTGLIVSLF